MRKINLSVWIGQSFVCLSFAALIVAISTTHIIIHGEYISDDLINSLTSGVLIEHNVNLFNGMVIKNVQESLSENVGYNI